jgi:nucleotide sugar dehydrogenase
LYNVGVIGHGFVGTAIVHGFSLYANIRIFDTDPTRATHSLNEVVNDSDFVFIGVPTPMTQVMGGEIDLSIMDKVMEQVSHLYDGDDTTFIIKSTVIPGTVEKYISQYPNLNIVFNPEFLTERSARLDFINCSRIVIGGDMGSCKKVEDLYRTRFPYTKIIKTDVTTAQFIKYMANCFFATKVSFMNEMKQAAIVLDANWHEVMDGFISDGRIGNSHLDVPGHDGLNGFGGKCFPKDLNAFIGLFKSIGVDPKVMVSAWEKNLEVREKHDWAEIEGAVTAEEKNV